MAIHATANFQKLNSAIQKYANHFNKDLGKVVRYVSVGMIKDVAKGNPVYTGRSRAGWLPFLWKMKAAAPMKAAKNVKVKNWSTKVARAQQEGLRSGTYNYKFDGRKPFALIINNVSYITYLIYGVRKGLQRNIALKKAKLSAVSKQSDPDWFFKAVGGWTKKLKEAIKKKDRGSFR